MPRSPRKGVPTRKDETDEEMDRQNSDDRADLELEPLSGPTEASEPDEEDDLDEDADDEDDEGEEEDEE